MDINYQDEVSYYTINGEELDSRGKVLYDLTGIRIHMIDHVFDDKEVYDYVKSQIGKTREDIDDDKVLEAAARVVSMQLVLGIEVNMRSVVQGIKNKEVSLPEEFNSDTIRKVVSEREVNRELLEDGLLISSEEDNVFRGNK